MSYLQEVDLGAKFLPFVSFQKLFGFVPNVFRAQTLLPRTLEAEAAIVDALLSREAALSQTQKESIMLAVAAAYQNVYCVTGHYYRLRSLGVPDSQLDQIVIDHRKADLPAHDTTLLNFALKLAANALWVCGKDIEALREYGFADEAVLEAILVTALSNFFCTLSVGLGSSPDFEPRAIPRSDSAPPRAAHSYVGGAHGPYLRSVELSPDSFPPLFLERFGFIPNLFRAQTLRPDLIEAEADAVRHLLGPEDALSHIQKECILLVGSAANLNTYCVAAHCEVLRLLDMSMEESDQIALDHHQTDLSEADKTLLDFVSKLTVSPSEFRKEDIDELRRMDFSQEQILETVVVTALNNFFNTLQMGLGTTPDVKPTRIFVPKDTHPPRRVGRAEEGTNVDPDFELVARVQGGELDAFEELITRHSRRVYRTLVGIVGTVDAEDATQDTFLKAFQHIGTFQHRSKFSTWLLNIACNTGLQRLRDRRRLESLDDDPNEEEGFRPRQVRTWAENPEQLYSRVERRELVESGVMQLPPMYRVVLLLRDIEQLSTEEAAAALGLGIPALKARLFRGRLMLREVLSAHFAISTPKVTL
jgi:RNA polymerase sigma-70 factor (ECF subfamily)